MIWLRTPTEVTRATSVSAACTSLAYARQVVRGVKLEEHYSNIPRLASPGTLALHLRRSNEKR
jgi:hypothetical protein